MTQLLAPNDSEVTFTIFNFTLACFPNTHMLKGENGEIKTILKMWNTVLLKNVRVISCSGKVSSC